MGKNQRMGARKEREWEQIRERMGKNHRENGSKKRKRRKKIRERMGTNKEIFINKNE